MRGRALAVLAVALGAAGAWLWFRAEPAPLPPTRTTPTTATAPVPPPVPAPLEKGGDPAVPGPHPTGPCTLRGRALNPDGTPWIGSIGLVTDDATRDDGVEGPPPPPVRTDAEGRFAVPGLPRSTVRLYAEAPGGRRIPGPVVLLPADEEVPFVVGAGLLEVEGKVVADADGRPVAGAVVRVAPKSYAWFESSFLEETTTDGSGRFRVRIPDGFESVLTVQAAGFLEAEETLDGDRPVAQPAVEIRLARGASLEGRVLDAATGKPVPAVRVVALVRPAREATSDGEGKYSIGGLHPGLSSLVYALGGGWISREFAEPTGWDKGACRVEIPDGGTARRDLRVVAAPRLKGRVLDAEGKGAAGILVKGRSRDPRGDSTDGDFMAADPLRETTTAEDGTFGFPTLLPGVACRFHALREGVEVAAAETAPPAPGETVDLEIRLPPDRSLVVRVLDDATGAPVADIRVSAGAGFLEHETVYLGRGWTSGPDGTVRMEPLPALPLRVNVEGWTGHYEGASVEVDATSAAPVDLRIKLVEGGADLAIEGTILFPDGSPAATAAWECEEADFEGIRCFGTPDRADYRGRFRSAGLARGSWRITATCFRGGVAFAGEGVFEAGTLDAVVRLHDRERAAAGLDADNPLRFRVLGPDGKPLPAGESRIHFLAEDDTERSEDAQVEEGACAFALPERGEGRMWLEVGDAADAAGKPLPFGHEIFGPFPVVAGEVEVRLLPESAVEGRLVDEAGAPVAEGVLNLEVAPDGTPGEDDWITQSPGFVIPDADGRFRIGRAGNLPYLLVADAVGKYANPAPVPVRGGTRDIVVVLRRAVAPAITVLGPDGKPVPGAFVRARPPGGQDWARGDDGHTDPRGIEPLLGLNPGMEYALSVEPPRDRGDLLPAAIEAWKPADTTVHLERAFVLSVLVKDRGGSPVEGASVTLEAPWGDGKDWMGTDATGRARYPRLPAGRVRLCAGMQGPGGQIMTPATAEVSTDAGEVVFTIDPGGEAALRVRAWDGKACWGLAYFARDEDLEPAQAGVGDDGVVRLRGLRSGASYTVYIRQWHDESGEGIREGCAILSGVRAGDPLREVDLVEGKEIRGKAVLPAGAEGFAVAALHGKTVLFDGHAEDDGTFVIPALPEGLYTVIVYLTTADGAYHTGQGTAAAGGTVEIRVP